MVRCVPRRDKICRQLSKSCNPIGLPAASFRKNYTTVGKNDKNFAT
jgi:hypothetical protein